MKIALLVAALACGALAPYSLFAQSKAPPKTSQAGRVSDSFAKAAIIAVRGIQSDKNAEDKMDAAEAEAVSQQEQNVLSELIKLRIRFRIEHLRREAESYAPSPDYTPSPLDDCVNDLVTNLTRRSGAIPKSCPK
jgi:hypothetical protein